MVLVVMEAKDELVIFFYRRVPSCMKENYVVFDRLFFAGGVVCTVGITY